MALASARPRFHGRARDAAPTPAALRTARRPIGGSGGIGGQATGGGRDAKCFSVMAARLHMFSTRSCDGLPCASLRPSVNRYPVRTAGEAADAGGGIVAVSRTVCAGSPVPFDPVEIDRKLAAAHSLN